jgi:hypothetical protein
MSSRGRGLKGGTSREMVVSPRRGACSRRVPLPESSRSTVSPMKLYMYMSTMPLVSTGMLTMRSRPISKGMSYNRTSLGGTWVWAAVAKRVSGSQSLCCKIAFIKLQTDSEIVPHSKGQGEPPKESLSIIRTRQRAIS